MERRAWSLEHSFMALVGCLCLHIHATCCKPGHKANRLHPIRTAKRGGNYLTLGLNSRGCDFEGYIIMMEWGRLEIGLEISDWHVQMLGRSV